MPTKTRPTPPAKPPVTATRKALLAYHSELQKYHKKLEQWEAMLSKHQADLIEARENFEEMIEEEGFGWDDEEDGECECGPEEAMDGCPCPTCDSWRDLKSAAAKPAPAGDEVQFLESLFKLKDKRKK